MITVQDWCYANKPANINKTQDISFPHNNSANSVKEKCLSLYMQSDLK